MSERTSEYASMYNDFIKALGGGTAIAKWVRQTSAEPLDREAVYKWAQNGVPWKWRGLIARMAAEKGVPLPDGFLPGMTVITPVAPPQEAA